MNRIIKFRVWDKYNKRWLFPNKKIGPHLAGDGNAINLWCRNSGLSVHGISEGCVEFQQFTGLQDSKGKDIYEGDIVKCRFNLYPNKVNFGIIEFCAKYCNLGVRITKDRVGVNAIDIPKPFGNFMKNDGSFHIKIVGNIFENSELVKSIGL